MKNIKVHVKTLVVVLSSFLLGGLILPMFISQSSPENTHSRRPDERPVKENDTKSEAHVTLNNAEVAVTKASADAANNSAPEQMSNETFSEQNKKRIIDTINVRMKIAKESGMPPEKLKEVLDDLEKELKGIDEMSRK